MVTPKLTVNILQHKTISVSKMLPFQNKRYVQTVLQLAKYYIWVQPPQKMKTKNKICIDYSNLFHLLSLSPEKLKHESATGSNKVKIIIFHSYRKKKKKQKGASGWKMEW